MKIRVFCFLVSFLFFQSLTAQREKDSLFLKLNLKFGNETLQLNKDYISNNTDTLQFSAVRFYISKVQVHFADGSSASGKKPYHLIDIDHPNSLQFPVSKNSDKTIKSIQFQIGVDSLANVSGAMEGDLDPAKGMYWAWQSGYINMKIEGSSPSCKSRKNQFHFHLGGYVQPNYAMRNCTIKTNKPEIAINIAEFFSKVKLSEINSIMIPGKKAMELADYSVTMFKPE